MRDGEVIAFRMKGFVKGGQSSSNLIKLGYVIVT